MKDTNKSSASLTLFIVFITVLVDLVGFGIIIPIITPLILNPMSGVLPITTSAESRNIILGFLIASYPIAQFFSASLLGELSDRFGRKPILILSLIGSFFSRLLFAYGIFTGNIILLFASRIVDGATGGNISIATSAIADVSTPQNRAKNFGIIGSSFALGFIFGPYIAGDLIKRNLIAGVAPSVAPLLFAALLSLINVILVVAIFPETLKEKIVRKLTVLKSITNVFKAFNIKALRSVFITTFLFTFGFQFFTTFFTSFLFKEFKFDVSNIGDVFAYLGLWIAISQGFLIRPLAKKFKPQTLLSVGLLGLAISFMLLLYPRIPGIGANSELLKFLLPLVAIFNGIASPNATALVSNYADDKSQGEVLGLNQSVQSLAQVFPAIIAGFASNLSVDAPIILGAISVFLAFIVFKLMYKSSTQEQFHEE